MEGGARRGAGRQLTAASLFDRIPPMMRKAALGTAPVPIPGAADAVAGAARAGVPIGSCTGYTREMMADILPLAAEQGYAPDVLVCAGDNGGQAAPPR